MNSFTLIVYHNHDPHLLEEGGDNKVDAENENTEKHPLKGNSLHEDEEFVVIQVFVDPLSSKKVEIFNPQRKIVRAPAFPTRA
ncbi:Hypothetical protein PHPALM_9731 [Phytophthora palmivora]|uniref:Uncharacterized protein n=1 Tax=Phytophthora palmivora TaxID=4796 RepID=A0A2P4Y6I1_9STRA|nr:Hypothetical protein PHPALM_9731 [Phytophthora palmivora]